MITTTVLEKQKERQEELHVILGISGNTGRILAQELRDTGYKVRGISRSGSGPEGIEVFKANALNIAELTNAVKGATVIYHCLGIPYTEWGDKHPIIMKNLIQAAAANGTSTKIVFADNMYAYGEKGAKLGPMNEQTPELATDWKGKLRIELGKMLLQASHEGLVRVSIGRASDFFGPDASNSVFNRFVLPSASKHTPAQFFADIETQHSWMYLPDFARSIMTLGTNDKADGKVWILPHFETNSIREFVRQFYTSNNINIPVTVKSRSKLLLDFVGLFDKNAREYSKMHYQRKYDWIANDLAFRKTFSDFKTTDRDIAFRETLKWYTNQKKNKS